MIDEHDQIDAIFLTARHGRDAPGVAEEQGMLAADRGDTREARRWRTIRRFIRRSISVASPASLRGG